jgi:hypothetical protein
MRHRNPFAVALLSLVTLDIYLLYWLYVVRMDLSNREVRVPSLKVLLYPTGMTLLVFACGAIFDLSTHGSSATTSVVGLLIIASTLSIIPVFLWWVGKLCYSLERASGGRILGVGSFLLFLLLAFIGFGFMWPGVVQDKINRLDIS